MKLEEKHKEYAIKCFAMSQLMVKPITMVNYENKFTFLGLTQQASVRRGPRASATSLFTVSLTESEASAFLPNRVCVSPNFNRSENPPPCWRGFLTSPIFWCIGNCIFYHK